jgi:SAM-dependent methyltransferase
MADVREFYDGLAPHYDVLFEDWWAAAQWHGSVVAQVLARLGVEPPARVLDATCGIGTQALPLAERGFRVTGTDLSATAVERAQHEAAARGIAAELAVADVRDPRTEVFDAVLSCDNALPHLLTDDDLRAALRSLHGALVADGVLLASLRDYDALAEERPAGVPIVLHGRPGARHGAGQAWRWSADAAYVDITLVALTEGERGWTASAHETRYRALRADVLTRLLAETGFRDVRWLTPEQSGYYQPIVTARA